MHTSEHPAVETRRREIAAEHLLFKLMEWVEATRPGFLQFAEESLDGLGDYANDETRDDEAVRAIARRMLAGAKRQGID